MVSKELLMELIEKERLIMQGLEAGSEEYVKSLYRLMDLEKQLAESEKIELDVVLKENDMKEIKKDRLIKNILEGVKVGSSIVIPFIGLVWITATEKDSTFTGTLREYTKYFLPNKLR